MERRIIIFTGKGGVGKTSVAAAHALKSAREGKRTLLVSTDMAHNLSDIFEQKLGNEPMEVQEHLRELAQVNRNGSGFLVAYGLPWLTAAFVGWRLGERLGTYAALFQGMVGLPLGLVLTMAAADGPRPRGDRAPGTPPRPTQLHPSSAVRGPTRGAGQESRERVLPSGSSNHATRVPSGAVQMPRSSWSMPS